MIDKSPNYLHCQKYKGQPQKHVVVCKECRWRKNCKHTRNFGSPSCLLIFEKRADPL